MAFSATNKAPGVYIDEVQVAGPIPGASTSIAAFIGPAKSGPIDEPTFLTSWTEFVNKFGGEPDEKGNRNPYFPTSDIVYVTYAMRGFFDNGGVGCYFTRVSAAERAGAVVNNVSGPALSITAKAEGTTGNNISYAVTSAATVPQVPGGIQAVRINATLDITEMARTPEGMTRISISDEVNFVEGDVILLQHSDNENQQERVVVQRVIDAGDTTDIVLNRALSHDYGDEVQIRIADLERGQQVIRLNQTAELSAHTYVKLSQGQGSQQVDEVVYIEAIEESFIYLKTPLSQRFSMDAGQASVQVQTATEVAYAETALSDAAKKSDTVLVVDSVDGFAVGDTIAIGDQAGATYDRLAIAAINADDNEITLDGILAHAHASGAAVAVANLEAGQRRFRLTSTDGIYSGSYLKLDDGTTDTTAVVSSVGANGFVMLDSPGLLENLEVSATGPTVTTWEFSITLNNPSASQSDKTQTFANLSMDYRNPRYFPKIVDNPGSGSWWVDVTLPANSSGTPPPPDNMPNGSGNLSGGANENLADIDAAKYVEAIALLQPLTDVSILCIPDGAPPQGSDDPLAATVQNAMLAYCLNNEDCFAVLDPQLNATVDEVKTQIGWLTPKERGYGALYYPQVIIPNPVSGEMPAQLVVQPSGHLAGMYARVDDQQGVFKAPANETLIGALTVAQEISVQNQGFLNEDSVNVIRTFPGSTAPIVWGARTVVDNTDTQWRYINVRRLLIFIEKSIQDGTRFAVFEPNNKTLWGTVKRQVVGFLTNQWQNGALVGDTPDQAFQVIVNDELNPPEQRALGILTFEVILYPTTPAEYIVFRIIQEPGGPRVTEA